MASLQSVKKSGSSPLAITFNAADNIWKKEVWPSSSVGTDDMYCGPKYAYVESAE